jgi:RNA polymerase sigma-70 factor (ECF subfamily)
MGLRKNVREAMLEAVPSLRAFAISLCGNVDRADDLVQETLLRAWANMGSFQLGTNMSAWLPAILNRSPSVISGPDLLFEFGRGL